jgi:hypothetical protein
MRSRTLLLVPMAGLALILAACSSAGSSTSAPASTPPASTPPAPSSGSATSASLSAEPASGSGAQAAIQANWVAFFSGKTSAAQKIALLQDGQTFAGIVNDPANLQMGQSASATVHNVTISGTTAAVTYDVGISGFGLTDQHGTAIYQDGIWKVGDASFCGLITLEHVGHKQGACQSVS